MLDPHTFFNRLYCFPVLLSQPIDVSLMLHFYASQLADETVYASCLVFKQRIFIIQLVFLLLHPLLLAFADAHLFSDFDLCLLKLQLIGVCNVFDLNHVILA